MAVRRKPLSAKVVKNLKEKAKKSKLFNLTDLRKSYKQLINIGLKNLSIEIHFGPNLTWNKFSSFMNGVGEPT